MSMKKEEIPLFTVPVTMTTMEDKGGNTVFNVYIADQKAFTATVEFDHAGEGNPILANLRKGMQKLFDKEGAATSTTLKRKMLRKTRNRS